MANDDANSRFLARRRELQSSTPSLSQTLRTELPKALAEQYNAQQKTSSSVSKPKSTNTAFTRSGADRDTYDSRVRNNYAKRNRQETESRETPGFLRWLSDNAGAGLSGFNQALFSTADFLLPTELIFGEENDPVSWANRKYTGLNEQFRRTASETNEAKGGLWKEAGEYVLQPTVQTLPNTILALMSGGTSLGASSGTLASGQAAGGLGATVSSALRGMAENPLYWTSAIQMMGPAYDDAKSEGADELEATATGLLTGLLNAGIEVGGGLETLPSALRNGNSGAVRQWVHSMLEEGKEEVVQGVVENLSAKAMYDQDRTWASLTDEDAVFNPVRSAQEFAGGAVVGGILGGGQLAVNRGLNALAGQMRTNTSAGEEPAPGQTQTDPVEALARAMAEEQAAAEPPNMPEPSVEPAPPQAAPQTDTRSLNPAIRTRAGEVLNEGVFTGRYAPAFEASGLSYSEIESALTALSRGEETGENTAAETVARILAEDAPSPQASDPVEALAQAMAAETAEQARARSEEVRARNRRQVEENADVFGAQGREALMANYDGEAVPADYYGGFAAAYHAGLTGADPGRERRGYGARLTGAQRQAAYEAGRADAAASLKEQQRAAAFAPTAGTESGLEYDAEDGASPALTAETVKKINTVAKALGVRVRFAGQVRGGTANSSLQGSEVRIEKDNPNPVLFLLGHEWTHRLQELAPGEYRKFRDFAAGELQMETQVILDAYRAAGEALSYEGALDEAAANYAGRMIEDGAVLDAFIERHRTDRTLLEKVRDAIRTLVRKLTGAERRQAKTAEGRLTKALEAAARQAGANTRAQTNAAQRGGAGAGPRFSLGQEEGVARSGQEGYTESEAETPGEEGRPYERELYAESAEQFRRRMDQADETVSERASGGYRIGGRLLDFGRSEEGQPVSRYQEARRAQRELSALGIESQVYAGAVEINRDGETLRMEVPESTTLFRDLVLIQAELSTDPVETAGHEAFHMWARTEAGKRYQDQLLDEVKWSSPVLREKMQWLEEHYGESHIMEELAAYLSGEFHAGNNEAELRQILLDYDAVKAAWEALVEENRGGTSGRFSLKTLTEAERGALLQYKSSESYKLNTALRDGTPLTQEQQRTVDALDRALEKLPTYSGTVYRRLSFDLEGREALDAFLAEHNAGDDIFYPAFTSASTEADGYPVEGDLTVTLVIRGKSGRDLAGIGNNFEREIVFPRGSVFSIEQVESDNRGKPIIHMREVAEHGAGQLYSSKRHGAVQQMPEIQEGKIRLRGVHGMDSAPEAHGQLQVLRAERGDEAERTSLKGSENAREVAALRRENERLREQVAYWKGQTRTTTPGTVSRKAAEETARALARDYGSQAEVSELTGALKKLYDYLGTGKEGRSELTYTEARRRAEEIARTLVEEAVETDTELYEAYRDLREYLRGTELSVSAADRKGIPDYGDFRKRNFGRLKLTSGPTNVDQVYRELSALWPEFFDETRENTPTDQLLRLEEVAGTLYRRETRNPFSDNFAQAVSWAASDILERFFDLPQMRTYADRQAAKLERASGQGRARVQRVREQSRAREEQLRAENRERVRRAIQREQETRQRQLQKLKDRYQARERTGRDRKARRELRGRILRHTRALSQRLLRPTDKRHIPEALREPVRRMLEAINLESTPSARSFTVDPVTKKRIYKPAGTPTNRTKAFLALKEQYQKILAQGDSGIVVDPSLFGTAGEDGIQGDFDAVIAMRDIRLADMTKEQLETVWRVVKAVEHSITSAGKILSQSKFRQTSEWAEAMRRDTAGRINKRPLTKSHISFDLEDPYTFFHHYGDAGRQIYNVLNDALSLQQLRVSEVYGKVREIVDPKTVKKLERETKKFTTERGERLTLTTAQAMEIYELMKRKQAYSHLLVGGIVQPEIESANIQRGTDSIKLTVRDLAGIANSLTEEQVKIADGLQALTAGLLSGYGNEASMRVYGYNKFTEENYWPIRAAKEGVNTEVEKGPGKARSIKNIGFAKAVTPNANNPIDVSGVFDTFSQHAGDMIDYSVWLAPMEDLNRLYNFRFRDAEGKPTGRTIKGILDRVGGTGAQKYWSTLMEDIQNGIGGPNDTATAGLIAQGIGSFKGAAVGANLRVMIQQPTAYLRAAVVLAPGDMAKAFSGGVTKGSGWKKALKYSPIAMRKDAGGFDISNQSQLKETLFDTRTKVRKLNDTLSKGAAAADAITWGTLWNACEWQVARENKGLRPGSEAFYSKVNEAFTDMVNQTQVVDSVLHRPQIMRSNNAVLKQATSFMGEPLKAVNILMRAYDQFRYENNPQKRVQARKRLARAAAAVVMTNVINALAQSLVDALRDDDEDKKYWERFLSAFTGVTGDEESAKDYAVGVLFNGNLGSALNPANQLPFVKDVLSIWQGYDVNRTEMEVVAGLVEAAQTAIDSADGTGRKTRAYAVKELLSAGAKLFGIPVGNLARDVWATMRTVVGSGSIPVQYEMEKAIYNITNDANKSRYYDIMFRALKQGDMDSYEHIRADLMNRMGLDGETISGAMRSRYNKAAEEDPSFAMDQAAMDEIGIVEQYSDKKEKKSFGAEDLNSEQYQSYSSQRAKTYREWVDTVQGYSGFDRLDDENKDKVITSLEQLAGDVALRDSSGGKFTEEDFSIWERWATGGGRYGVSETEAALFKLAYDMSESEVDRRGNTISGSKKENTLEEAERLMPWLTDEELDYLMANFWTPEDRELKELKENKFLR